MRRVRPFPFDRLDRIARAQVDALAILLAHLPLPGGDHPAAVALLGGPIAIRLLEAYAFPVRELPFRLSGPPLPTLVRLGAGGDRSALLAIDPLLAARLVQKARSPGGSAIGAGADHEIVAALVGPLCQPAGVRVEGFLIDGAEVAPLFPDALVLGLDAQVATPVGDGWVRLWAPERLRLRPPRPSPDGDPGRRRRLEAAQVSLVVEIGGAVVRGAELAGLSPGDVLVCDRFGPRPPFGGPVALRLGRGRLLGRMDGEGITILSGFELGAERKEPRPMDRDDNNEVAGPGSDALLRELPVEVVCELGRVTLSGRELLELRPGAVLPVGRPLAGPIDLSVGGRVIARGELVDVEGELGVRINQVMD